MLKLLDRTKILWGIVGVISIGLISWTIIVGDQKRLPESAAPAPNDSEQNNNKNPAPEVGDEGPTTTEGEQPAAAAPPPEETKPEETTPAENTTSNEETKIQKGETPQ